MKRSLTKVEVSFAYDTMKYTTRLLKSYVKYSLKEDERWAEDCIDRLERDMKPLYKLILEEMFDEIPNEET